MEAEFAARAAADRDLDERDRRGGVLPRALEGEAARRGLRQRCCCARQAATEAERVAGA